MSAQIINFPGITRLDLPVTTVISQLELANLESIVVLGYDISGNEYFASSEADGGNVLWLLERAKKKLLEVPEQLV